MPVIDRATRQHLADLARRLAVQSGLIRDLEARLVEHGDSLRTAWRKIEGLEERVAAAKAAGPGAEREIGLKGDGYSTVSRISVPVGKLGPETKVRLRATLERDRPDILAAFERGEYLHRGKPSMRKAAIAAGIVRVPTPLEVIARDWAKLNDVERDRPDLAARVPAAEAASALGTSTRTIRRLIDSGRLRGSARSLTGSRRRWTVEAADLARLVGSPAAPAASKGEIPGARRARREG